MQNDLRKGDTIQCKDKDDMLNIDIELCKLGYTTDYLYEKDGQNGYWIEIKGKKEV